MRILLQYFWPALIPIIIYLIAYALIYIRAKAAGNPTPKFFNKNLTNAFILSLVIAIMTFIAVFFVLEKRQKTDGYVPARVIDGKLEPGHKENR